MNIRMPAPRPAPQGPEHVHWHPILVRDPSPSDFGPYVVAPTGHNDGEMLAWKLRHRRQLELRRAEFVEGALRLGREQLIDDAAHGVESKTTRREIDLAGRRHNIRLVADVHDERFAVDANDRLEERGYEAHDAFNIGPTGADY